MADIRYDDPPPRGSGRSALVDELLAGAQTKPGVWVSIRVPDDDYDRLRTVLSGRVHHPRAALYGIGVSYAGRRLPDECRLYACWPEGGGQ